MFKIKLSILFLISISLIGCLTSRVSEKQFNISSVANDSYFLYENTLVQYLDSMGMYNNTNYDYLICCYKY